MNVRAIEIIILSIHMRIFRLIQNYLNPTVHKPFEPSEEDIIQAHENLKDENVLFWKTLNHFVPQTPFVVFHENEVQILNVACGHYLETAAINSYFGGNELGVVSNNVFQTGIDFNEDSIEEASDNNTVPSVKFVVDDFAHPQKLDELPKEAEVVIIRNQQAMSNRSVWRKIFKNALSKLSGDGIMLITSLSESEHKVMVKMMKKHNASRLIDELNPITYTGTKVSWDRNVAVFQKEKPRKYWFF